MTTHELKIWPEYVDAVASGAKAFEIRLDDRGYKPGDILRLEEWDPKTQEYTGRELFRRVTYVMHGGKFGLTPGWCVMSLGSLA